MAPTKSVVFDSIAVVISNAFLVASAAVALEPLRTESSETIRDAVQKAVKAEHLRSVRHVVSYDPSVRLFAELKKVCPGLAAISLDPMHIAFTYESPSYRRRVPGSIFSRKILARAVGRGVDLPVDDAQFFSGDERPDGAGSGSVTGKGAGRGCSLPRAFRCSIPNFAIG